jgi:cytochrome c-type biogenesis protein CcmF
MAVCLFTYILQRDHLKSDHKLEALVSRESSFLFNNVVLLAACFTVLWGTLFPVLSEFVQGNKVTVSAPFYDRVAVPIGLFLLFLTGIGPLLAWRSTSLRSIRKNFIVPAAVGLAVGVAVMFAGVHPWALFEGKTGQFYSWVTFVLAAAVTTAIGAEFFRGARVIQRHTGKNLFSAVVQLTRRNTRRYGGYLVHFGVVVIFIGFAGSAFNQNKEAELNYKQSMTIGPYRLQCLDYSEDTNPNYDTEYALLNVYRDGKFITQLDPSKRFYEASQQVSTIVANRSTPLWDLYVIYAGKDDQTGQPIIRAFLNPLVMWIWIGVMIVVLGTLLALVPNSQPASSVERASRQAGNELGAARKAGV